MRVSLGLWLGLCLCLHLYAAPLAAQVVAEDVISEEASVEGMTEPQLLMPDVPVPVSAHADELEWLRRAQPETVICPFRGRIRYEAGEIECGLIQVPENREVAGSRTIELHYVRIAATGKDVDGKEVEKRDDPVIYLTGGPGVGVEYYVGKLRKHRVIEQRDLFILEQRGIGSSSPFCPFFDARNRADQNRDTLVGQQHAALERVVACIRNASAQGVDVRGYNTIENARDVRALRQALGLASWNVWGISYGSALGQAVARVDAEGVRAMVVDAIVPIDIGELMRLPSWYQRDLDKLAAACADQAACAKAYPQLLTRYEAAIQSAFDQPFALEVKPSELYPQGKAHAFADIVAGLPFSLLYEQSNHPALPAIMDGLSHAVEARDDTLFKAIALAEGLGMGAGGDFGAGMANAVRCQDGYVDQMVRFAAGERAQHPLLTNVFVGDASVTEAIDGACARAGLPPRDPALYAPLISDIPIVVANGAWDPITPTPLAEYIMPGLSKGRLVEFPHAGHGPTRSLKCGGVFLNRFYDDPSAALDMECVESGEKAASYIAPYFRSSMVPRGIVLAAEERKRAMLHGAWGGLSAVFSLIGLLTLMIGWLARRLDRRKPQAGSFARWLVGLSALSAVTFVSGLGAAVAASQKVNAALLLFGFVGWAQWFAWAGVAAGVFGLLGLIAAITSRLPRASRIGFVLVSLAAVSVSVFGWYWDVWPF